MRFVLVVRLDFKRRVIYCLQHDASENKFHTVKSWNRTGQCMSLKKKEVSPKGRQGFPTTVNRRLFSSPNVRKDSRIFLSVKSRFMWRSSSVVMKICVGSPWNVKFIKCTFVATCGKSLRWSKVEAKAKVLSPHMNIEVLTGDCPGGRSSLHDFPTSAFNDLRQDWHSRNHWGSQMERLALKTMFMVCQSRTFQSVRIVFHLSKARNPHIITANKGFSCALRKDCSRLKPNCLSALGSRKTKLLTSVKNKNIL